MTIAASLCPVLAVNRLERTHAGLSCHKGLRCQAAFLLHQGHAAGLQRSLGIPQYAPRGKGCRSEHDNRVTSGKEGAHAEATHAPNLARAQLHGRSPWSLANLGRCNRLAGVQAG